MDYVYARGGLIATRNYTIGQQCTTDNKGVTTCTTVLQSTAVRYYLSDVWSTRLVLDVSGNVIGRQAHLPFGEEFAESGTQEKHHFTSYEAESESGTDYAVNRQYSQSVGRFGSADPYEASSYLVNPQSWNRYSYVENDPIHNVDPLGLLARYPDAESPDPCCSAGGCSGDSTPINPPPTPIDKHFRFPMNCKKNAVAMMNELKASFGALASWQSTNLFISFERRPITGFPRLEITSGIYLGPSRTFHVNVIRNWPTGWTFGTESDHVFYPGTIKFSAEDVPSVGDNLMFRIDLFGFLNGISADIGFLLGFGSFEDETWEHLATQIKTKICN